jgi:hypothetical protein
MGKKPTKSAKPRSHKRNGVEVKAGAAKPSEVRASISQNGLKRLLKQARTTTADARSLAGQLGQAVASAVENDHLHRKAFNIVKGLDRMEPEKLADTLDCLDHYLDISGLRDRAAKVMRLGLGEGAEGDESEEEEDADNVVTMPRAAE